MAEDKAVRHTQQVGTGMVDIPCEEQSRVDVVEESLGVDAEDERSQAQVSEATATW